MFFSELFFHLGSPPPYLCPRDFISKEKGTIAAGYLRLISTWFCQRCGSKDCPQPCWICCLKQAVLFKHFRPFPHYATMLCCTPTRWELSLYSLITPCLDLLTPVPSLRTSFWNSHLRMLITLFVSLTQGLLHCRPGIKRYCLELMFLTAQSKLHENIRHFSTWNDIYEHNSTFRAKLPFVVNLGSSLQPDNFPTKGLL